MHEPFTRCTYHCCTGRRSACSRHQPHTRCNSAAQAAASDAGDDDGGGGGGGGGGDDDDDDDDNDDNDDDDAPSPIFSTMLQSGESFDDARASTLPHLLADPSFVSAFEAAGAAPSHATIRHTP